MRSLLEEKWDRYARVMKNRGLGPEASNRAYLDWWKKELGVE